MALTTTPSELTATALTLTTAAQPNITSVGTLTALTGGTGDLIWDTNTLVVDSSANKVGIGTTGPLAKLDFGATSTAEQVLYLRQNGNSRTSLGISSQYGLRVAGPSDAAAAGNVFEVGQNLASDGTTFQNTRFVVQYDGKVGIGVSDPSAPLDIETAGNTNDGTFYSTFTINNTGSSTYSRLRFDRSGVAKWGLGLKTDDKFQIVNLFDGGSASADDNCLVIDNVGRVGIGTSTPQGRLVVAASNGGNGIETQVTTHATNKQFILAYDRTNSAYLNMELSALNFGIATNNGTTRMHITSAGKVGIGETTPLGQLHVKTADSGATADASADEFVIEGSANSGMSILSGATSTGSIYFGDSGTNWDGYIAYSQNDRKMTLGTAATAAISITSGQDLGVGTSNPLLKVTAVDSGTGGTSTSGNVGVTHGNGNIPIGAHNENNSATYSGIALETRTSGASRWLIANEWTGTYLGDLAFHRRTGGSTSAEAMRINSSGRVGIGTTAPVYPLVVAADATNWNTYLAQFYRPDGLSHVGEPFSELILQNHETTAGYAYGGMTMMALNQAHLRFQVGNTSTWGGTNSKRWQIRLGLGNTEDKLSVYSWTAATEVMTMDSSATTTFLATSSNYCAKFGTGNGQFGVGALNSSYIHTQRLSGPTLFYWSHACYASGGFHTYSDERLKKEVTLIPNALTKVKKMKGVTFKWTDPDKRGSAKTGKQFGVTAQNMLEIDSELPELSADPLAEGGKEDTSEKYYTMDYTRITPFLIEAIKEQQTLIETLQTKVAALEAK